MFFINDTCSNVKIYIYPITLMLSNLVGIKCVKSIVCGVHVNVIALNKCYLFLYSSFFNLLLAQWLLMRIASIIEY